MELVFKQKEKSREEILNDKIIRFASSLSIYFKRVGRDINGNPLYEANKYPVLKIFGEINSAFLFSENYDWFYKVTEHTFTIQSYSLKTDLQSIVKNILEGSFKSL